MIAIIDYGVGNLFSLSASLRAIGADVCVTGEKEKLKAAEKIILPGVGAFRDARRKLDETGLVETILEEASAGKPLLGICLGMQLLFKRSLEYGVYPGLGLLPGEVRPIETAYKIPHIGWNSLSLKGGEQGKDGLFRYVADGAYVYYVHSYCAADCAESVIATSDYGTEITGAVREGNVMGTQFHPEKSGDVGLRILRAFCEL